MNPSLSTPAQQGPQRPQLSATGLLGLALLLGSALALHLGAVQIAPGDWLLWPGGEAPLSGGAHVLWHLRLPRVGLSLAVGAALGLAGCLSQALFRNPMADPGLLGISAGAAAAVALCLTLFAGLQFQLPPAWRIWLLPVAGFAGALGVCWALERLARWLAPGSVSALLLCGLAVQALAFALVGLCSHLATDEQLRALSFWSLGSLAGANGWLLLMMSAALLAVALQARRWAQPLNALALGREQAAHVGVDVQGLRRRSVLGIALLSALAVSACGSIGFIGLMAPHLARQLVGPDLRRLMPCAMLTGALLLLLADTLARTLAVPAEIPVGIFSALLGAPCFLWLLRQSLRHGAVA